MGNAPLKCTWDSWSLHPLLFFCTSKDLIRVSRSVLLERKLSSQEQGNYRTGTVSWNLSRVKSLGNILLQAVNTKAPLGGTPPFPQLAWRINCSNTHHREVPATGGWLHAWLAESWLWLNHLSKLVVRELAQDSVLKLTEVLAGFCLSLFQALGRKCSPNAWLKVAAPFQVPRLLRTHPALFVAVVLTLSSNIWSALLVYLWTGKHRGAHVHKGSLKALLFAKSLGFTTMPRFSEHCHNQNGVTYQEHIKDRSLWKKKRDHVFLCLFSEYYSNIP